MKKKVINFLGEKVTVYDYDRPEKIIFLGEHKTNEFGLIAAKWHERREDAKIVEKGAEGYFCPETGDIRNNKSHWVFRGRKAVILINGKLQKIPKALQSLPDYVLEAVYDLALKYNDNDNNNNNEIK